jgi:hypothetical protein
MSQDPRTETAEERKARDARARLVEDLALLRTRREERKGQFAAALRLFVAIVRGLAAAVRSLFSPPRSSAAKESRDGCARGKARGSKVWVIAEGYIPEGGHGPAPTMTSHETVCILNASGQPAHVALTIYFSDREPVGRYRVVVPARRTRHLRFNDLREPEPIPRGTDYSCVIESDVRIVVQHTRLDSRQSENALMTTVAYPAK